MLSMSCTPAHVLKSALFLIAQETSEFHTKKPQVSVMEVNSGIPQKRSDAQAYLQDTSIVYDGIRLTYGMKTGTYDYFHQDMLGSTLITLCDQDTSPIVEYLHSRLEYVPVPGAWKDNG